MMDLFFLAAGGFLLGSVFYTGYYTTRYEPEVKLGYAVIGLGVLVTVVIDTWLNFFRDASDWFRLGTFLGYLIITIGLILIVRVRRKKAHV
jgi:hypothetical protein